MSELRCNICYLPIHDQRSNENCPRCFNDFHRDHFAAWLLSRNYCPMCRNELSADFIDSLRPKSERERRRLEDISRTLDGLGDLLNRTEQIHKKRIMKSREKEHGIERLDMGLLIKAAIPFVLLLAFLFVLILAISQTF